MKEKTPPRLAIRYFMPASKTATQVKPGPTCSTSAICKNKDSCSCGNSYDDPITGRWISGVEALAIRKKAIAEDKV